MLMGRILLVLVVSFCFLPRALWARDACHPDQGMCDGLGVCNEIGVCVGDITYAQVQGELRKGRVSKVFRDGRVELRSGGARDAALLVPRGDVAISKAANCLDLNSGYCVGAGASLLADSGSRTTGVVLGYFPLSGDVLFLAAEKPVRISREKLALLPRKKVTNVQNLVARVKLGEDLRLTDFLHTWQKDQKRRSLKADPWKNCTNAALYDLPIQIEKSGEVVKACMPDTLYSWGPLEKVDAFRDEVSETNWGRPRLPEGTPAESALLYATRSPISTFAYRAYREEGSYGIRVKLKPTVKFKEMKWDEMNCKSLANEEADSTVFVRMTTYKSTNRADTEYSLEDFVLCSAGPIHSWSFGTREFYDEMVRETERVIDPGTKGNWYSYLHEKRGDEKNFRPVLFHVDAEELPFTQMNLIRTLKNQLLLAAENGKTIFFRPGAQPDRKSHFSPNASNWLQSPRKK